MSNGLDLLGQIAHARAAMLRRGHRHLKLIIGTAALEMIGRDAPHALPLDSAIIGMEVIASEDVEGFLVIKVLSSVAQ